MKAITVLFFISLISIQSIAQENQDIQFYQKKLQKYQNMQTGGILLSAIGSIVFVLGARQMADTNQLIEDGSNDKITSSEIVTGAGAVMLGIGIPLAIIGSNQEKKYKRTIQTLSVGVSTSCQCKGIALTFKF